MDQVGVELDRSAPGDNHPRRGVNAGWQGERSQIPWSNQAVWAGQGNGEHLEPQAR
jgi:hypothetical protein